MINYKDYEPETTSRKKEDIEWTIAYSYDNFIKDKPRALLIGDSICHQYSYNVKENLSGKCLVSYWTSSKCVTDPSYFRELDFYLDAYDYSVISLNNGLHSLDSDRNEWEQAYRSAVKFIKDKKPNSKLFLTLCTPLQDPELTAKSMELNCIVKKIAEEFSLPTIDLFTAMDKRDRDTDWSDCFHFKMEAIKEQAEIIAKTVTEALNL